MEITDVREEKRVICKKLTIEFDEYDLKILNSLITNWDSVKMAEALGGGKLFIDRLDEIRRMLKEIAK